MKIAVIAARVLLGLMFLVFGLNDFLNFIKAPLPPGDAGVLSGLLFSHGWFKFHGVLYVIAGVLLLVGRYVPIALVILGPILVNILLFHITFLPEGIGMGVFATLLEVFLIWAYWPAFRGLFVAKTERY